MSKPDINKPVVLYVPGLTSQGISLIGKSIERNFAAIGMQTVQYNKKCDPSFDNLIGYPNDLEATIDFLTQQNRDRPIFIYTESFGGEVVLRHLANIGAKTKVTGVFGSSVVGDINISSMHFPWYYIHYYKLCILGKECCSLVDSYTISKADKGKDVLNCYEHKCSESGMSSFQKLRDTCEFRKVDIPKIQTPVMLLTNRGDTICPFKGLEHFMEEFKRNRYFTNIIVNHGGHCSFMTYNFNSLSLQMASQFFQDCLLTPES